MVLRAYNHGLGLSDDESAELPEGWQSEAFRRLHRVELYANPETARIASEAYSAAWRFRHDARFGQADDRFYDDQEICDAAMDAFVAALRRDLHVPDEHDD